MEGGQCPMMRVKNVANPDKLYVDNLHKKTVQSTDCSDGHCNGSIMNPAYLTDFGVTRPKAEVISHAEAFLAEYYSHLKLENSPEHMQRWNEVHASIDETGFYYFTADELQFGAKTAWRNAPRCIGRRFWTRLEVFDGRHCTTAKEMFETICKQMEYATNGGNIRSAISVFPHRTDGRTEFRVWNSQLVSYAGHKMPDGSILGDPINVQFTRICERMGYKFDKTQYDILPLVLQANGEDPEIFEIPRELIHEVEIRHPKYDIFEKMGLKWYALPAVANMLFDCGGLQFPAAPFNGWYMTTEIAVRDFCDESRLNMLPKLAEGMGFDVTEAPVMWKDRAIAEIHYAVVHSFKRERTTIVDHYTATETFMEHFQSEYKERGGCPADWVWLVPPMSGSLCPVFHQEMISYKLKPSYDYQAPAWKVHEWKKENPLQSQLKKRFTFRAVGLVVRLCLGLSKQLMKAREKCTIVFATETGKAAKFAEVLSGVFKKVFDVNVVSADEYFPICRLVNERLILFVASTFGNGEPPGNAERFYEKLEEFRSLSKKHRTSSAHMSMNGYSDLNENSDVSSTAPLHSVRYGVFGLGSRLYPHFCAFGHTLDDIMSELGAIRCIECGEGDELKGQEQSFRDWTNRAFQAIVNQFYPTLEVDTPSVKELMEEETVWTPDECRCVPVEEEGPTVETGLSKISAEPVLGARLRYRKQLQAFNSDRKTLLVSIDRSANQDALDFKPGDHIALFPPNPAPDVDAVIAWMQETDVDTVVSVEKMIKSEWRRSVRLPACSVRMALTRLLDLCATPGQNFLANLSLFATDDKEKKLLEFLSKDVDHYEAWRLQRAPNIALLTREFPSARPTADFLLDCLPSIKPRYYSISSSPAMYTSEIHLTVALVEFKSQDGVVHRGMCTSWLNTVKVNEIIPCYIRRAPNFRLPENPRKPVVMVGPGTGIAPFRSFWQEREFLKKTHRLNNSGPMVLYFGCRSKLVDHIYDHDIKRILKNGTLTDYQLALSRESGQPKVYVQDLMWKQYSSLFRYLVTEEGHFYVCGDVQMANDVKETLITIFEDAGGMDRESAQNYLAAMKKNNRFHEDIFGATSASEKRINTNNRQILRRKSAPASQLLMDSKRLIANLVL